MMQWYVKWDTKKATAKTYFLLYYIILFFFHQSSGSWLLWVCIWKRPRKMYWVEALTMSYCNEYKFSLDSARESRTSGAFFRMKYFGHLALRNTWWIYQDLAVLTKTLLTNFFPGFLHPWSSCNLLHFAAHLAHFPVPISVFTELDQYSNLF